MRTWIRLAAASLVAAGVLAAATVPVSAHDKSNKSSEFRKVTKKKGSCQAKMVMLKTKNAKALAKLEARFESKKSDPEWEGRSEELAAKYEKKRLRLESAFSKKSLRLDRCAKQKKK